MLICAAILLTSFILHLLPLHTQLSATPRSLSKTLSLSKTPPKFQSFYPSFSSQHITNSPIISNAGNTTQLLDITIRIEFQSIKKTKIYDLLRHFLQHLHLYRMMRFQRVSPDCIPLSSGSSKKRGLKTPTCKEEDNYGEHSRPTIPSRTTSNGTANYDAKNFRFRSPSRAQDYRNYNHSNGGRSSSPVLETLRRDRSLSPGRGTGDMLLQWGQKKRARVPRMVSDDSSSSGQGAKVQKKAGQSTPRGAMTTDKPSTTPMPPPPLPPHAASDGRVGTLRKESSVTLPSRNNLDERSGVANRSPSRNSNGGGSRVASRSVAGKRSPPSPDKSEKKMPCSGSTKDEKANGSDHRKTSAGQSEHEPGNNNKAGAEKSNAEVVEWPRIFIALSRKEKEDDFLAMKGTKLPHRPKKRSKNVDKALQYCFPGMWLSDLTKSRYEVREKRCVKKQKRRGLKGMENMDSDSE